MTNHQWDADPLMHLSPYTSLTLTPYLLNNALCMSSYKFLDKFTQCTVIITLSVSLMTKLWNVSHILLILMSCEMFSARVAFVLILLDI